MKSTRTLEVELHLFTVSVIWFLGMLTSLLNGLCCGFRSSVPDVVETLLPLLSSSRTRREVVSHMVSMGLVDSVKDLKKEKYDFIVISVILKVKTSSRVETFCSVYNPNFWLLCKLFFFFSPLE